jgi:hypothetical protein
MSAGPRGMTRRTGVRFGDNLGLLLPTTTAMRYYEQKYPEVDELVMVQVRQIAEMGAYVKLVRGDPSSAGKPSH